MLNIGKIMQKFTVKAQDIEQFGNLNFDFGVGEDFATNLYQQSLFNNEYIEKVKEKNINKIIDYEKHLFYPAYFTKSLYMLDDRKLEVVVPRELTTGNTYSYDVDKYARDINDITFNLYIKRRNCDENNDYGSWDSLDENYWNIWDGTMAGTSKILDKERSTEKYGDLLGYFGFNDDDVFYQKNNLKKSFIRISIYDSPYRQTQKVLFYSTLFFDTNVLYKKFTNLNKYPMPPGTTMRVYQSEYVNDKGEIVAIPEHERLTATFTCTNKYEQGASSDGFYLYLFHNIVQKGQYTPLYMKIDFNNAKYGKSIPFIYPHVNGERRGVNGPGELNTQIPINDENFPEDYEVNFGSDGNSYVDIKKLYEDLYIPIFVRYNNIKNRFEWYVNMNFQPPGEKPDTLSFKLYEPRINKLK